MPTENILSLLISERDRLNRAIEALRGGVTRRGRPPMNSSIAASVRTAPATAPAKKRQRKPMTPAQKKAHSERMKAFWAERRKKA